MKKIVAIEQLHRRRLTALEAALKQARAQQASHEAALAQRQIDEHDTREAGRRLKRDIDAALLSSTVKRADIDKAQHRLTAAKDDVAVARQAVVAAEEALAQAIQQTEAALVARRRQAAKVEKFDALVQGMRAEHSTEVQYREEMALEDIVRKRA